MAILAVLSVPIAESYRERQEAAAQAMEVERERASEAGERAWRDGLSKSDNPYGHHQWKL